MEPLPGRRENNYYCEEENLDELLNQRPPPAYPPRHSSSSSASPTEDHHPTEGRTSDGPSASFMEKEHMFDKVVTPSDVGKLNRLVIPKQHAEKYFPLDASAGEKGLLLNFEDRAGKHWRFRYSYWNSSQSYVMTKGWSRFVKEKHLDAGDTVSFGRGVGEAVRHRLFIDWKRRPDALPSHPLLHRLPLPFHSNPSLTPFPRSSVPWGRLVVPPPATPFSSMTVYDHLWHPHNSTISTNPYLSLRSGGNQSQVAVQHGVDNGIGVGGLEAPMPVFNSVPASQSDAAVGKTVRLFGVNLGYSPTSEAATSSNVATHVHAPPRALSLLPMRLGASELAEPQGAEQQPASMDLAM